jgi:hypothetical protein
MAEHYLTEAVQKRYHYTIGPMQILCFMSNRETPSSLRRTTRLRKIVSEDASPLPSSRSPFLIHRAVLFMWKAQKRGRSGDQNSF